MLAITSDPRLVQNMITEKLAALHCLKILDLNIFLWANLNLPVDDEQETSNDNRSQSSNNSTNKIIFFSGEVDWVTIDIVLTKISV